MKYDHIGTVITAESIERELHKALATAFCRHVNTDAPLAPYCQECFEQVQPLVYPVAKAILTAAMFERRSIHSGHVGMGQALELLITTATERR